MTSINTNVAATVALRTLQETSRSLESTQRQISTGLKIGEAKDNAAYWSIATTLKSDNKSLSTVKDALGLGAATVDTAYQGLNKAKEVLDEIKSKLTAATQDGVDRAKIQTEIAELQKQLSSIASSSTFSGENWLSVDSSAGGYTALKNVVAGVSRNAAGAVSINTIGVDTSALKLFDTNAASKGIVDTAGQLKKSDGTALLVGGTDSSTPPPVTQGVDTAVSKNGANATTVGAASAALGTFTATGIDTNGRLSFNIAVNGGAAKTVYVDLAGVGTAANLATAIDTGLTAAGVTGMAATDSTGGVITLKTTATGSNTSITVTGLQALDGNGKTLVASGSPATLSAFGLTNTAAAALGDGTKGTYTGAAYAVGTAATGSIMKFTFEYNGDLYDATTAAQVAGTGTTPGQMGDAASFKITMEDAISKAVKRVGGGMLGANKIVVDASGANIKLTTADKGTGQKVSVSSVTTYADATALANGTADATAAANTTKGFAIGGTAYVGVGVAADYALGTYTDTSMANGYGDTISFDISMGYTKADGSAGILRKTVSFATASATGGSGTFLANAQAAIDAQFGAGKMTIYDSGSAALKIKTVEASVNASVTVNGISMTDGDGTTGSKLGMSIAASAVGTDTAAATGGKVTSGSGFVTQTFAAADSVSFDLSVNGGAAKTLTISKAVIESALTVADGYVAGSGQLTSGAQYLKVVQKAMANAAVTGVTASIVASGPDAGKLQFETSTTGAGNSLTIGNVQQVGANVADTISVDKIDITDAKMATLGVTNTNRKDVMAAYISIVNDAINKVTTAASTLGSVSKRIDLQQSFVDTLMDSIDKGVSGLVDADISEESTKLQALQVKQQLGVQALSIANQSSQQILRLFQ